MEIEPKSVMNISLGYGYIIIIQSNTFALIAYF